MTLKACIQIYYQTIVWCTWVQSSWQALTASRRRWRRYFIVQCININLHRQTKSLLLAVALLVLRQFRFGHVSGRGFIDYACSSFVHHRYGYISSWRVQVLVLRRIAQIIIGRRWRDGTCAANNFLALSRENDTKFIAKVVLKVNESSIGINVFCAWMYCTI